MLVATGNDVRVMSIKLADRLHNMRTLGVMRPEKQARIAKVTRDVLIPLAERLGVQALKTELEDLVFAILHPEEYAAHTRADRRERRPRGRPARRGRRRGARGAARGRHPRRSPHPAPPLRLRAPRLPQTRRLRGTDFGRLLVLVDEDADCYAVLGELHTCMTPVISEFKDFIAVPKFNLYQSLHTAVARPADGQVAEVLIRTHQMHQVAEAGVIALGNPYAPPPEEQAAGRRRARRPDAPRLALPAAGLAARRTRPRHLLVHPARRPRPGPRDHRLPPRRRHPGPARGRHLRGRRLRAVRRGRARLHRRPRQRPPGDPEHGPARRRHRPAPHGPGPGLRALQRVAGARPHARRPHRHPALAGRPSGAARPGAEARRARPDAGTGRGPPGRRRARARTPAAERRAAAPAPEPSSLDLPGAPVRLAGCCTPVPPDEITGFAVRGGVVTVHRAECPAVAG